MRQTLKSNITLLAGLILIFLFGCKKDSPDPTSNYFLVKVSGDDQYGFNKERLDQPLKVKLLNKSGVPEINRNVIFALVQGNGFLFADTVATDQNGEAEVAWRLGSELIQTVKAYFPDATNPAVLSPEVTFTAKLKAVTVAGGNGYGSAANQFGLTYGVAVDKEGNLFVADNDNHRVQKWAPGAKSGITVAGGNGPGSAANQLTWPVGIFLDASGNLFIADSGNDRIQKWSPGATSGITVAGGNGHNGMADQLMRPKGVFVDDDGSIYIADTDNHRIQKWAQGASSGVTVTRAGFGNWGSGPDQLMDPSGVWVDASGNVFVADTGNDRVQKWAPGAKTGVTVAGGNGSGNAPYQLGSPCGIFLDASGNLFIADQGNDRVQKWAPGASSGVTVAGQGAHSSGSGENQLLEPTFVCLDVAGNIYVSDLGNKRVQKWLP